MTDIYDQTIVRHHLHVTPEPDAIEQVRRRLGWRLFVTNCPAEMLSLGDAVYASRALTAQVGWGGNDAIEAFYLMARVDANGKNFDGAHAYQLRWENDPPVNVFWSLTMYDKSYDGAAGYLVKNPINRYSRVGEAIF